MRHSLALILLFSWMAWISRAAMVGGVAFDLWTTQKGIALGAHESNPLVGNNPVQRYTVVIGSSGVFMLVDELARRDGLPAMANWAEIIGGGVHTGAALHNLKVIQAIKSK